MNKRDISTFFNNSTQRSANYMNNEKQYLKPKEAADLLKLKPQTLTYWRFTKQGPPYHKIGDGVKARVIYEAAALHEWVASRKTTF